MPAAIEWTDKLENAFIDGIISGISIEKIAKQNGISPVSFYRHRIENESFERTIARAQEAAIEREMDNLIDLADEADEDNHHAIKLKVWTRMWVAGKRKPKKYGEKLQQEVTGELGIKVIAIAPGVELPKDRPALKPAFDEKLIEGE